jgi:Mn2+/Fe2+ NRAMP family transporter
MNSSNVVPRRLNVLNWRHFMAVAGPGLVVMLADTDSGSIITAAQSGAEWGYGLLLLQAVTRATRS